MSSIGLSRAIRHWGGTIKVTYFLAHNYTTASENQKIVSRDQIMKSEDEFEIFGWNLKVRMKIGIQILKPQLFWKKKEFLTYPFFLILSLFNFLREFRKMIIFSEIKFYILSILKYSSDGFDIFCSKPIVNEFKGDNIISFFKRIRLG